MLTRTRITPALALVLLAVLPTSCERNQDPNNSGPEQDPQAPAGGAPLPSPFVRLPDPAPDGWEPEIPPRGSRVASFRVTSDAGSGDEAADMSVNSFSGSVGGILANVNRWRNELGQPPVSEAELPDVTDRREIAPHTLHLVDVSGRDRRTLGAILPLPGQTWFFKLTGPAAVVGDHRSTFLDYLDRLALVDSPPDQPPGLPPLQPLPELTYQTPEGWVVGKSTPMRAASLSVTSDDGRIAYLAVIPLEGSGGALLANVNQWRATLDLASVTEDQLPALLEEIELDGRNFQLLDLVSAEPLAPNDHLSRLVVAFTTAGDHTWFFKFAGHADLVAEQKPVLLEFLRSVEFAASR